MLTLYVTLRWLHIAMGATGLASGFAAMVARKGSNVHARAGTVFFVSMLLMAGSGAFISTFLKLDVANIMAGTLTMYLVLTARTTVARAAGTTGHLEIAGALLGLGAGLIGMTFGMRAVGSPIGTYGGYPPPFFFVFGGIALLGVLGDARLIRRGGVSGVARTTRHLWRMGLAMLIATASFFAGQADEFPAAIRASGILLAPILIVIALFLYWFLQLRLFPRLRRLRNSAAASAGFRAHA